MAKNKKTPAKPRDENARALAEGTGSRGQGTHHNRDHDVAKGRTRKPKHKKDWSKEGGVDAPLIRRVRNALAYESPEEVIARLISEGVSKSDAYWALQAAMSDLDMTPPKKASYAPRGAYWRVLYNGQQTSRDFASFVEAERERLRTGGDDLNYRTHALQFEDPDTGEWFTLPYQEFLKMKTRGRRARQKKSYFTLVLPPGDSQWHSPNQTITRGTFKSAPEAHAWAKSNIPGSAYTVQWHDDPEDIEKGMLEVARALAKNMDLGARVRYLPAVGVRHMLQEKIRGQAIVDADRGYLYPRQPYFGQWAKQIGLGTNRSAKLNWKDMGPDSVKYVDDEFFTTISPATRQVTKQIKEKWWPSAWSDLTNDGEIYADGIPGMDPGIDFEEWERRGWRWRTVTEEEDAGWHIIILHKPTRKAFEATIDKGFSQVRQMAEEAMAKMQNRVRPPWLKPTRLARVTAAYSGNPDGKPIYPVKVDHGELDQALSGGHDIMKRLQDRLLIEQGKSPRPGNERLAVLRIARRAMNGGHR